MTTGISGGVRSQRVWFRSANSFRDLLGSTALAGLLTVLSAVPAQAQVFSEGKTLPEGEECCWNVGDVLVMLGPLVVEDQGSVTSEGGVIGNATAVGSALIDARPKIPLSAGSAIWDVGSYIRINSGALDIVNGGQVLAGADLSGGDDSSYIGSLIDSAGRATIDGEKSVLYTNSLQIGASLGNYANGIAGTGTLNILNGGAVYSERLSNIGISLNNASAGSVTVAGPGSLWSIDDTLGIGGERRSILGYGGTGTLTISDGGTVINSYSARAASLGDGAYVGNLAGAEGIVTVRGDGSNWTNGGDVWIGAEMGFGPSGGGRGELNIEGGGLVRNADAYVGYGWNDTPGDNRGLGAAGSVTVTGTNSTWANLGDLHIAAQSGRLNANGFLSRLGTIVSATGTLTISHGGHVSNTNGYIGNRSGATGTVTVRGDGSRWTNDGDLFIGAQVINSSTWNPGAGTLNIENGGRVTSGADAYLGYSRNTNATASGTVNIVGPGSIWTNSGQIHVAACAPAPVNPPAGTPCAGAAVGSGFGKLTLANGGLAEAAGVHAGTRGGIGTIEIGGVQDGFIRNPGVLDTPVVTLGTLGTLVFNHARADYVFDAAITGEGVVRQLAGTTILAGNSSYSGVTVVEGGELRVTGAIGSDIGGVAVKGGGRLSGTGTIAGAVTVETGGMLRGASGATLTMGSLVMERASILDIALGSPSDAGLFRVDGDVVLDGQLNITSAGGFGAGLYRLIDHMGTLTDNGLGIGITPNGYQAGDLSLQTAIANQVNLLVRNSGGGSDPDDPDPFSFWQGGGGTIRIGEAGFTDTANHAVPLAAGQFLVFMGEGGALQLDDGGGAVEVAGLQFAGDGYALEGDALIIAAPATVIRVGDGTAAGAAMIARIAAPITGSGGIVKTDEGTLILAGTNGFAGNVRIESGTLSVSGNANLGDAGGEITLAGGRLTITGSFGSNRDVDVDNGTIDVAAGRVLTLSGAMSGAGGLTKAGAGTLILAGSGGLAGPARVQAGRLSVNGVFNSAVDLSSGGILGGTGRVGAVTVGAGATLAPGNSIGTLRVDGPLSFEAGSVFEVEVDAAGMADGVDVAGAVALHGGTVSVLAADGDYRPSTRYEILTAGGGVEGRFANVTSNLAFLLPSLTYSANAVSLELTRNNLSFAGAAITPNQIAAGQVIDGIFGTGTAVYDHLIGASLDEARATFDALSGEIHPAVLAHAMADTEELRQALVARDDPPAGAFALWGQATGNWTDRKGDGNAAPGEASGYRLLVGAELGVGDHVTLGLAGGGSTLDVTVRDRASSAGVNGLFGALYGHARLGRWRLRAGIGHTNLDIDTRRDVDIAGAGGRMTASYDGSATQAWGELGMTLALGGIRIEPFAGLIGLWFSTDDFAERGGTLALEGQNGDRSHAWSSIGMEAGVGGGQAPVAARARLSWDHGLRAMPVTSTLRFAAGGEAFAVAAAPLARDAATVTAGLAWRPAAPLTIGADYVGAFSDRGDRHGARLSATLRF